MDGGDRSRRLSARRSLLAALLALTACAPPPPPGVANPPRSAVASSGGLNRSASYLARVEGGIVVFDLGWWGAEGALEEALSAIGGTTDEVIAVFLTHSHRDHVGAWRSVAHAPFHMAAAEVDLFFREAAQGGWVPRWIEALNATEVPEPGEVEVRAFAGDTAFTFGADTVRAFTVPGHTAGSAAYLFRGTLFAGDAIGWSWHAGIRPARAGYSDDADAARRSLSSLRERLEPYRVEWMCSAHLKCAEATDETWEKLLGEGG